MGGVVPPLPQYAFMAWCSVRGSAGTTLPLPYPSICLEELKENEKLRNCTLWAEI